MTRQKQRKHKKSEHSEHDNLRLPEQLKARNAVQKKYLSYLKDDSKDLVVAEGPAGTGKTFLACTVAADLVADAENEIEGIVLTRPTRGVEGGELGALPGGVRSKLSPWMRPMRDALVERLGSKRVKAGFESGLFEEIPVEMCRGLNLRDKIIVFDEAQNATPGEAHALGTRAAESSRFFACGDPAQTDLGDKNGLRYLSDGIRCGHYSSAALVQFDWSHVERSRLCRELDESMRRLRFGVDTALARA